MTQLEIIIRLVLSFFLAWSILCRPDVKAKWATSGLFLSVTACGFGITDALLGGQAAVFSAFFILSVAVSLVIIPFNSVKSTQYISPVSRVLSTSAVCFLAGRGMVLISLLIALVHVLVDVFFVKVKSPHPSRGSVTGEISFMIKAQDIRGIIGKVEGVLERFQVRKKEMRINQDREEKELHIKIEAFVSDEEEQENVFSALNEIEGVIQLAVL